MFIVASKLFLIQSLLPRPSEQNCIYAPCIDWCYDSSVQLLLLSEVTYGSHSNSCVILYTITLVCCTMHLVAANYRMLDIWWTWCFGQRYSGECIRFVLCSGAYKCIPGNAKCVTEILGGTKIWKLGETKFTVYLFVLREHKHIKPITEILRGQK